MKTSASKKQECWGGNRTARKGRTSRMQCALPAEQGGCRKSSARWLALALTAMAAAGRSALSLPTDHIETQCSFSPGRRDNRLIGGKHPLCKILSLSGSTSSRQENTSWARIQPENYPSSRRGRNPSITPSRPSQFCVTTSHPLCKKARHSAV